MDEALRIVQALGVPGLVTYLIYRLLDKYAGRFLDASQLQANAIQELASSLKDSASDQKDVLMAVRVLAAKTDEAMGWIKQLDGHVRGEHA